MKHLLLTVAFLLVSSPAFATMMLFCTFDQECIEGESCNDTSFPVRLSQTFSVTGGWGMATDSEQLDGTAFEHNGGASFVFLGETSAHYITLYDTGAARYTLHMEGPFSITYHGTCKDNP